MRKGREAIAAKNWDAADEIADRLIVAGHRNHARVLRGESLFDQNRLDSAFDVLNRIGEEGELQIDAMRTQARCLVAWHNLREADKLLRIVLSNRTDDLESYRCMAIVTYDLGSWGEAEGMLLEVARLAPEDGRPHWNLGVMYRDLHRYVDAETHFRNALARNLPGDLSEVVRTELATALHGQKRYEEALRELDAAGPDQLTRGLARLKVDCLRSVGKLDDAIKYGLAFLRQLPDDPGLQGETGIALMDARRASDALPLLEKALAKDNYDTRARDALRRAYQSLRRTDEASAQLKILAEQEKDLKELYDRTHEAMGKPRDAAVRRRLSELCTKIGKPDLATMWARAAAACDDK